MNGATVVQYSRVSCYMARGCLCIGRQMMIKLQRSGGDTHWHHNVDLSQPQASLAL